MEKSSPANLWDTSSTHLFKAPDLLPLLFIISNWLLSLTARVSLVISLAHRPISVGDQQRWKRHSQATRVDFRPWNFFDDINSRRGHRLHRFTSSINRSRIRLRRTSRDQSAELVSVSREDFEASHSQLGIVAALTTLSPSLRRGTRCARISVFLVYETRPPHRPT